MKIRPVAECGRRFARSRFQSAFELRRFRNDAHPAPASSGGSLDQNGIAGERGKFARRGKFRSFDSRHHRDARRDGDSPCRDLVAERSHHVGPRSDEHDPRVGGSLRELGTLGEKSVARMYRVGVGSFCGCDYRCDVEVALCGLGRSDCNCLVSGADVRAFRVRRGIHGDGFEAEQARAADDPKRNLAAVCDKEFFEPPRHDSSKLAQSIATGAPVV